jgi:hypothetical protein
MLDSRTQPADPPLAAPPPRALVGIIGNEPHQSSGLFDFREHQLAIVEFDDQAVVICDSK